SEAHNVPIEMLVGISMYETGWMQSDMFIEQNNPGGLRCNSRADWCGNNGFAGYNSVEAGLQDKAFLLRNHYFNNGMTTLTAIQPVYAPSHENDGDGWIRNIASIMDEVKMFL
ncbi:MAG: glucosaminidase domain-containing protein, partial [Phocaeicola sp.]